MDKEATQVIHQTIALPEAITAIVALKCLPISHKVSSSAIVE